MSFNKIIICGYCEAPITTGDLCEECLSKEQKASKKAYDSFNDIQLIKQPHIITYQFLLSQEDILGYLLDYLDESIFINELDEPSKKDFLKYVSERYEGNGYLAYDEDEDEECYKSWREDYCYLNFKDAAEFYKQWFSK